MWYVVEQLCTQIISMRGITLKKRYVYLYQNIILILLFFLYQRIANKKILR